MDYQYKYLTGSLSTFPYISFDSFTLNLRMPTMTSSRKYCGVPLIFLLLNFIKLNKILLIRRMVLTASFCVKQNDHYTVSGEIQWLNPPSVRSRAGEFFLPTQGRPFSLSDRFHRNSTHVWKKSFQLTTAPDKTIEFCTYSIKVISFAGSHSFSMLFLTSSRDASPESERTEISTNGLSLVGKEPSQGSVVQMPNQWRENYFSKLSYEGLQPQNLRDCSFRPLHLIAPQVRRLHARSTEHRGLQE